MNAELHTWHMQQRTKYRQHYFAYLTSGVSSMDSSSRITQDSMSPSMVA
jgi:hypothetical protein